MKTKFEYMGKIQDVHMFREIPDGPVKDVSTFQKYFNFFTRNMGESFFNEVKSRADFLTWSRCGKQLTVVEEK